MGYNPLQYGNKIHQCHNIDLIRAKRRFITDFCGNLFCNFFQWMHVYLFVGEGLLLNKKKILGTLAMTFSHSKI